MIYVWVTYDAAGEVMAGMHGTTDNAFMEEHEVCKHSGKPHIVGFNNLYVASGSPQYGGGEEIMMSRRRKHAVQWIAAGHACAVAAFRCCWHGASKQRQCPTGIGFEVLRPCEVVVQQLQQPSVPQRPGGMKLSCNGAACGYVACG